jgi:hypothetical protein
MQFGEPHSVSTKFCKNLIKHGTYLSKIPCSISCTNQIVVTTPDPGTHGDNGGCQQILPWLVFDFFFQSIGRLISLALKWFPRTVF